MKTFNITQFIDSSGACINRTISCTETEKIIFIGSYIVPSTVLALASIASAIVSSANNGLAVTSSPGDMLNIIFNQQDNAGTWTSTVQQTITL